MMNVKVHDNGAAFLIMVNGLAVKACNSLGDAWRHIEWMYKVASQQFTVGYKEVPVEEWVEGLKKAGYLD